MATNFPASLDTLTNPTSSDSLSSPSHSAQHANVNDAVEALQAKVGADSSAVTSSHDYKIAQLEAGATGGKILQVVTGTHSTQTSTTSTTYVDTSLTATITPSATTSQIMVFASVPVGATKTGQNTGAAFYAVERGGSQLAETYLRYYDAQSSVNREIYLQSSLMVLDSPATTSATTYTWQMKSGLSATVYSFYNNFIGTLTLMEVSA